MSKIETSWVVEKEAARSPQPQSSNTQLPQEGGAEDARPLSPQTRDEEQRDPAGGHWGGHRFWSQVCGKSEEGLRAGLHGIGTVWVGPGVCWPWVQPQAL